jgi:hypothetical protein
VAQAHSHVEEHASSHDEEVSTEEDQAMVYDETIGTCMLTGSVTDDEGAISCPTYVDYEDDDTKAPHATLALSYESHDTSTYDGQVDGTHVEDAYDDEVVLASHYNEHSTAHPTYELWPGDMDPFSQETPSRTRTDGARRFLKDIMQRAELR